MPINAGIVLIPEDRKKDGLCTKLSIRDNIVLPNLPLISTKLTGKVNKKKEAEMVNKGKSSLTIKMSGPEVEAGTLSGGNQQKAIFGRWLERSPKIFMMDDPTRGIDVGAKYEIYELIIDMAKQGKTIIVVSSEMPEILGITNRIGVMSNGHLAGIVNTKETNQEELLRLSAKYL